ncbi:MAG: hypothetical protein LUH14_07075 [Clostridiaceae bacterium]|nr:hypothetical protein [Clostridiaceae bacterium]
MKQYPNYFYDGISIGAAYGCFPGAIWNGGRVILGSCTKQEMEYTISELNRRGIAVRYTFTNPILEKWHIADTFCNLCLELGDNGQNEVIVNSALLEDYIRKAFPSYNIISSTTKCISDTTQVKKELQKDYTLVVIDSALNNTEQLFSLEPKEKIELIANHYCADNCPKRQMHYEAVGKSQLTFSEIDFPACPNINRNFYQVMKERSFISTELLYGKYRDAGFCNFKLDGRAFHAYKVLESFVYYLILPEFRDQVRHFALKEVYRL